MVAITYARSVVDHTKVSEDELNDAINRYLGGSAPIDDIIAYKKKLIELLKLNVNSKDDIQIAASDNSSNLIEMMSSVPLDVKKADYYVKNRKVTAESAYVNSLLEEVGDNHA